MNKILIITVLSVLSALLIFYFYNRTENFTVISSIDKFVGLDKKINLMTTIGGKKYYLVSKKNCSTDVTDCVGNALVLIEQSDFIAQNVKQKNTDADDLKVCKYKHQVKCERMKITKGEQEQKQCENMATPEECIPSSDNSAEFNLIKVGSKYKLIGRIRDGIRHNKHSLSTIIGSPQLDKVCLDGTINAEDSENSCFELLEVADGYIIRFTTTVMLKNNYILHDKNGNPVKQHKYIGKCKDMEYKCNNENYSRLCFYDKEDNPFVLVLTLSIVQ